MLRQLRASSPHHRRVDGSAALFVQSAREAAGDRLDLVTFSSTANLDAGMALAATAKPALVGPAPFTTGKIGAISPGGNTSIGAGLGFAQLKVGGRPADNSILLLTDGQQNTSPTIQQVEPAPGCHEGQRHRLRL
jgi:hypothetical protein